MPNVSNIDERVVEMRIDNRQFVDGAEKTISILDRLKKALKFDTKDNALDDIQKSADKVNLSGIASDLDKLTDRFSTLGVAGQRVIQNLTDAVSNFALNTVKGLTIDPVSQGFGKYEETLRKTQTIMSATMNEEIPERFGGQLEYVGNQLDLVAWYTDETSASLNDMVANISKFTNVGIALEDAVWEMEGISNWGWSAGASVQEMSRAMYNLSQAMSVGSVKLMDWRSIENANMGTLEFKQTVLDTAVAMGTLTEAGDGLYKTMNGTEVSAKNFNEALSEGWFTSGVLEKTLKTYGEYSRRLGAVMDDAGFTNAGMSTSDLIEYIDALQEKIDSGDYSNLEEGLKAWQQELLDDEYFTKETLPSLDALRYSYELLTGDEEALEARAKALGQTYTKLSDKEFELAKRAFLMGQEYKTFGDVIDATKDAVSTGWMKTFQWLIGDAEQAKELWTNVGDAFYDIFVEGAARRNAILKWWATTEEGVESGRDALLKLEEGYSSALGNLYRAIQSYIKPISDAFDKVFSWGTAKEAGKRLREITYRIRDFFGKLSLSEEAQVGMTNFFKNIFSGIKKVLQVLKPVTSFIGNMFVTVRDFFNLFFESFNNDAGKFDKDHFLAGLPGIFGSISENVKKAWKGIKDFFASFSDAPLVKSIFNIITSAMDWISTHISSLIDYIKDVKQGAEEAGSPVQKIRDWFAKIWDYVKNINIDTGALKDAFGKVGEVVQTMYTGLTGDEGDFKERIKLMLQAAIDAIKEKLSEIKFSDLMEGARLGIMGYTAMQFANFVKSFKDTAKKFESIPEAITGTFQSLSKTIETYGKAQSANVMLKMAGAILMVAVAILLLSRIPEEKFAAIAVTLAFFFTVLSKIAKNISNVKSFTDNKNNLIVNVLPKFAASIIAVAILLAVAAGVFLKLKDLTGKDIWKGLGAMLGVLVIVGIFIAGLMAWSKMINRGVDIKAFSTLIGVAAIFLAISNVFKNVADIDAERIATALFGLFLIIGAVALVLYSAKNLTASGGFGALLILLGVAVLMNAIIPPFLVFANAPWDNVIRAVVMFGVIAIAIIGIMLVVSTIGDGPEALKGAASLVLVGVAFVLFAAALLIAAPAILAFGKAVTGLMKMLAKVDKFWAKLGLLAAFSVVLVIFGAALITVAAAALIFGAALLLGGVGFLAFGAGLALVASAIAVLTAVLIPFGTVLIDFCNMIAENGDVLVGVLGTIITAVLTMIIASKMNIAYSIVAVILAIVSVIVQKGPEILNALGEILIQILVFLVKMVPMLVNFLAATIVLIIDSLANSLRSNKAALVSAIENLMSVIGEIIVEVTSKIYSDVLRALGLEKWANYVEAKGQLISDTIYASFGGKEREAAREAGAGVVESYIAGLHEHDKELEDTGTQIKGIASHSWTDNNTNAMTSAMANVAAVSEEDLSISPTITPVVDTSNIESAVDQIKKRFGGNGIVGVTPNVSGNIAGITGSERVNNVTSNVNNTSNNTVNVSVYGSENMNTDELANDVISKISDYIARQGATR